MSRQPEPWFPMARSLPLGDPTQSITPDAGAPSNATATANVETIAGKVTIYDPAMCCPTGVCGPGVDPSLLQLARDLRWLEARGVTVERFGLAQEPAAFTQSPRVSGLLQAFGDQALPATLVNGEILQHGRYPNRDELIAALSGLAATATSDTLGAMNASSDARGAPGSDCC